MAQLTWVVFVAFTFHSSYSNPWTSLLHDSSQEYRKTDVPETQGEGWTSILGDRRKGRLLSQDKQNGGWTSLLDKYDRVDSTFERAPKIISPDDRDPEEDTIADGPEEKQFGNFGLPSFLPAQAGYYNPSQIYQVPSDNEIANFQNSKPPSQPTKENTYQ